MTSYHYCGKEGEKIPDDVQELNIHPLVRRIPFAACYGRKQLTRVNFNGSALTEIGIQAFYGCASLLEIEIPASVTEILKEAFMMNCEALTKVHFHEDSVLTSIGKNAFYLCKSLTEVSIPASVISIKEGAFQSCCLLRKVRFHQDGSLTNIEREAFAKCRSLTDVTIPPSVMSIAPCAFWKCQLLARVRLNEGLGVIHADVFLGCVKLENVDIPRSLSIIGCGAFYECASLQKVNFEEGELTEIGKQAFQGCVKLHTVNIPTTVERLETRTFRNCNSLEVVKFQNGLQYVEEKAFYLCKNLQAVSLPGSVEWIGHGAFCECSKLLSVEFGDRPRFVQLDSMAFSGCASLVNICFPVEIPLTLRCAVYSVFQGCTTLENQYGHANMQFDLVHRFENFPIHKRCHHASVTTTDELAQEIDSSMKSLQGNTTHDHLVDRFGLTPFHVLLSAASCRLDLLQILLAAYPPHVLGWKDVNGKTAVECLTQRIYLSEDSRNMLRMALDRWLVGSVSSWNALEAWKVDMLSRVNAIVAEEEVEQRHFLLREASMALSRYEKLEATTLLELSLWKTELNSANDALEDDPVRTMVDRNKREAYQIRSGALVVIPNVISFLHDNILT
ncbi:unnamed protein product [Cylindrotheca closterium]|uniref:Uncharacterized protein n=1 Tax=Cylindrotheca closterium TaxID=2856 RepID=A0AAD2PW81_9STRA|nr:unnamed protein product [Cylindrotheca closterium]